MPNTIKPTTVPQVALEGPLASVQEVDDVLAMPDVSIDPLTAGLPAEILDEGAVYAAQQLAKRQVYASALMNFHMVGSDDAKVKKQAGDLVRRDSVASDASHDELESPPLPLV